MERQILLHVNVQSLSATLLRIPGGIHRFVENKAHAGSETALHTAARLQWRSERAV